MAATTAAAIEPAALELPPEGGGLRDVGVAGGVVVLGGGIGVVLGGEFLDGLTVREVGLGRVVAVTWVGFGARWVAECGGVAASGDDAVGGVDVWGLILVELVDWAPGCGLVGCAHSATAAVVVSASTVAATAATQ